MGESLYVQPGEVWWSDKEERVEVVTLMRIPCDDFPDGHASILTPDTTETASGPRGRKLMIYSIPSARRSDWENDGGVHLFNLLDVEHDYKGALNERR